jgi:HPt (histidine-containing phosphotransfer) domain-containing protein
MANKPVIYKFEDTQTGKTYQVESDPEATRDEASAFLDGLKPEELGQYEVKAPATPTPTQKTPEVESAPTSHTVWTQGTGHDDFTLDPVRQKQVDVAATRLPYDQYSDFVKQKFTEAGHPEAFVGAGDPKQYAAYQNGIKTGKVKPTSVGYHDVTLDSAPVAPTVNDKPSTFDTVIGAIINPAHPDVGRDLFAQVHRGYDQGVQYGAPGWIARTAEYWTGAGQDELRKAFPGLSPEQYNEMAKAFIARTQEQTRNANAEATKNDNPVLNAVGQFPASAGPEDFVPGVAELEQAGRAAKVIKRTTGAVGVNAVADAGYQGLDMHDNVSHEFNPEETAMAGALGGGLHLGMEGLHALGGVRAPRPHEAPVEAPAPISAPTGHKNSKTYKTGLTEATTQVSDHVAHITRDWTNRPDFIAHENFKGTDADPKALGFYDPETNSVHINTERVLQTAHKLGVEPEVVTASVTYHESLGHHALAQKYGEDLHDTLHTFYDEGASTFRDAVDEHMEKTGDNLATSIEEVLANRSNKGLLPKKIIDRVANVVKDYGRRMGLNLKYSDREINTILAMTQEATTKGSRKDVSGSGYKYMNVGEKAEMSRAEAERIDDAIDMDKNGKDADSIYRATGWWKDKDGQWRRRVTDAYSHTEVTPEALEKGTKLGDVLEHSDLYEAYPHLKEMPVVANNEPGHLGGYSPKQERISLNMSEIKANGEDPHSVLLHEIQHAIQHHEGWARGGNTGTALHQTLKDHEITPAAKKLWKAREQQLKTFESELEALKWAWKRPEVKHFRQLFDTMKDAEYSGLTSEKYRNAARDYWQGEQELLKNVFNGDKEVLNLVKQELILGVHPKDKLPSMDYDLELKGNDLDSFKEELENGETHKLKERVLNSYETKHEAYKWLLGEIEARETEALRFHNEQDLKELGPGIGKAENLDPDFARVTYGEDNNKSMIGERRATPRPDDRMKREDQLLRREKDKEKLRDEYRILREQGIDPESVGLPPEQGNLKYMRDMTKEEAAEVSSVLSARKTVQGALDNYEPQARVKSWAEARREAADRVLSPSDIRDAKKLGIQEFDKKLFQYDDALRRTDERIAQLQEKIDNGTFTAADKHAYLEAVVKFNEMTARIWGHQAEIARALNAMKTIEYTRNKFGELNNILKEHEDDMLAGFADEGVFQAFTDRIRYLRQTGNQNGVGAALRNVQKPYWWEYLLGMRHSFMLSGLGTHNKNFVDNLRMLARNYEEKIVASPGFVIRKGMEGLGMNVKEGVSPQELAGHMYGILRAVGDMQTWKGTAEAFRDGPGARKETYVDANGNTTTRTVNTRIVNSKLEHMEARIPVLSKVGDALHAADYLFRSFHQNAELYSLGIRRAREEGRRGMDAFSEGSNYAVNPSLGMTKEAKRLADEALLVDTPSYLAGKMENWKAIRPDMHGGEQALAFSANFLLPFFRVTDRLLFQAVRRSPLSFMDKNTRADFLAGGARRDIAIARTLYGTALIAYYWMQSGKGNIHGAGPDDYKKRQALEAGGWKANSYKDGDKNVDATAVNISALPWGLDNNTAANIASLREAYESGNADHEHTARGLGLAAIALGHFFQSNSFANSLEPYIEPFVNNPTHSKTVSAANFVAGVGNQFIPAGMRQANQGYFDPVKRDTTGDGSFGDRVEGKLMASIPGQSEKLPAKLDVYGDTQEQGRSLSGIGNYDNIKKDPVSVELQRLEGTTPKPVVTGAPSSFKNKDLAGLKLDSPLVVKNDDGTIADEEGQVKLTAEGKRQWQKTQGYFLKEQMKQVVGTPEWKQLSDKDKITVVKQMKKDASQAAKEYLLPQLVGLGNSGEEEEDSQ